MSSAGQSHKKLKKPPACDNCKARRVLCHPQPNGPCPRCAEKDTICTTTPSVRGRYRKTVKPAHSPASRGSSSLLSQESRSSSLLPQESALALHGSADCPSLDPEFVAHCFECFECIPQVGHPLVKTTGIKDTIDAVSFDLSLLLPQSRALVLCIIAAASLASCHEAVLGPGPRPESLSDRAFFASTPDLRACGVRRAAAYRALRGKAVKAAWEIGVILEPTEENALSCFLLDLLEQSDSCGASRPWANAYISHVRALAPRWRTGKYTESDEGRWSGFLMSEALYATTRRMPISITLHDQLLLSGPEPPPLSAFVQSLESSKKAGLQLLWPSMKPYLFHVVELARQLFLEINGDYARLKPLSESAVIRFLSALTLLHSAGSHLLARVDIGIGLTAAQSSDRTPFRFEDPGVEPTARACGYGIIIGFISLVLPFYRELERRADEGESHVRERMQLFRAQARSITLLGLRQLVRALRYLPRMHYMPLNWRFIYPWAEFCAETVPENIADLETCVVRSFPFRLFGFKLASN
ncbi:hypothetical protein DFH08DRAFT_941362 [Mycena albidolilacea]|uniref:Zn(2)-C6 fungal-type domain-containing protein n=1 Tax=Mycena albidolilacea TaxID=1033008 RepID=A0AAD7EGW7_9AGAR|nr:hypothetical protein DFH08DRAFT_941362 [Mycena albidolilacea]